VLHNDGLLYVNFLFIYIKFIYATGEFYPPCGLRFRTFVCSLLYYGKSNKVFIMKQRMFVFTEMTQLPFSVLRLYCSQQLILDDTSLSSCSTYDMWNSFKTEEWEFVTPYIIKGSKSQNMSEKCYVSIQVVLKLLKRFYVLHHWQINESTSWCWRENYIDRLFVLCFSSSYCVFTLVDDENVVVRSDVFRLQANISWKPKRWVIQE
jgi:hypothetical protein